METSHHGSRQPFWHLLAILRNNMSSQNEGADVVSFGHFQAYSNIKWSIRGRRVKIAP
jgi:hypothetical protein